MAPLAPIHRTATMHSPPTWMRTKLRVIAEEALDWAEQGNLTVL